MNSMTAIFPYRKNGTWMFDDETAGLRGEPFIAGMPEILEYAITKAGIKNAETGFRLLFSTIPFPGYQNILKLAQPREQYIGHWYDLEDSNLSGWICPAMYCYFNEAPYKIYCQFSDLPKNQEHPNHQQQAQIAL